MRIVRALMCGALLGVVASPVAAQVIRGSVIDSTTRQPVSDFIVALLDEGGQLVTATTAGNNGTFVVSASQPGRYQLRLQRIGYRSTTSALFALAAGETIEKQLIVASVSVALDAVHVIGRQDCVIEPERGEATALVWDEARKALVATQLPLVERLLRLSLRDFKRELALDPHRVREEKTSERSGITESPYHSIGAAELFRNGYVKVDSTSIWFYAPDPAVLLSNEFAATHCLRLREDVPPAPGVSKNADLLALEFEPVHWRTVPDIAGVFWVDRKTAELRSLAFRYTNLTLPASVANDTTFGGTMQFQSMPGGAWVVRSWTVRAPVVERKMRPKMLSGARSTITIQNDIQDVLAGVHEEGGEVLSASRMDGTPLWAAVLGSARGTVTDAARRAPAAHVRVWLRGTRHSTTTDDAGRFQLDSLPPGPYTIMVARSPRDTAGSPLRSVDVRANVVQRADVDLPSQPALASPAACVALRRRADRIVDSVLAVSTPPVTPDAADSASDAKALRDAEVILQVAIDTLGHAEMQTLKEIRSESAAILDLAKRQLLRQDFTVAEPAPGCKVRRVLTMPFSLRPGS